MLVVLLVAPILLSAQDTLQQPSVSFSGYISDMPGLMYNSISGDYEFVNQFQNRLDFKWQAGSSFSAAAEMRARFNYNGAGLYADAYAREYELDGGIVDLTWNVFSGDHVLFNIAADRLWLDYSKNKWQLTLGRQRINWGQTFVWNPNDIFNMYNYLDFDYPEKPGSDALRLQYYTSETDKLELVLKADSAANPTFAGFYRFNRWDYDIQFLSGYTRDGDLVVGGGWAGQLAKGGFRGEISYFIGEKDALTQNGELSASIGWDYMFKNSLFLQLESLYNGNSSDSSAINFLGGNALRLSAKNPFLSDFSYFVSAAYPVTPLLNASVATIVNPENKVYILIPTIDYNIIPNMDLSVLAQIIAVRNKPGTSDFLSMWFLRMKYSF